MVTKIEKIKLYFKKKFLAHTYLITHKIITVLLASLVLLLLLGLFNYDYTIKNYFSCLALYFIIEEAKPFLLKLRGYRQ